MSDLQPIIRHTGFREIGPFSWLFCKLAAVRQKVRQVHLFLGLSRNQRVFWPWLLYSVSLLYFGKLSRRDTETVILRVAYLCSSDYELQQHIREALRVGLSADVEQAIFAFKPDPVRPHKRIEHLSSRQTALLWATDELVGGRLSREARSYLAFHITEPQLVEFCLLVVQYTGLAKVIEALGIENDFPDD